MDIRKRILQLMEERGWTIYRVAKEADIPWSTVRNMFKRNTEPSIQTLEALCKAMGMTLSQFFDAGNDLGLSKDQAHLLHGWNQLGENEKRLIAELIDLLNKRL